MLANFRAFLAAHFSASAIAADAQAFRVTIAHVSADVATATPYVKGLLSLFSSLGLLDPHIDAVVQESVDLANTALSGEAKREALTGKVTDLLTTLGKPELIGKARILALAGYELAVEHNLLPAKQAATAPSGSITPNA